MRKLPLFINRIMPYAWDDSLSVYEMIAKLVKKINEVVKLFNEEVSDQVAIAVVEELKDFTIEQIRELMLTGEVADFIFSYIDEQFGVRIEALYDDFKKFNKVFYDFKTTKLRYNNETDYYITEVPGGMTPRVGIANDTIGSRQSTIEFAKSKNATLVINGGISGDEPYQRGIIIQDGEVAQADRYTIAGRELLTINSNGELGVVTSDGANAQGLVDNGIIGAIQGFNSIIIDGVYTRSDNPTVEPIQIMAQKQNGDYIILTADGRSDRDKGLTVRQASEILLARNAWFAYQLDGGGSTATVNKLIKQNKNVDYDGTVDRANTTFLYWVKDEYYNSISDSFYEISKLRQELSTVLNKGGVGTLSLIGDCNTVKQTGFYITNSTTLNTPITHPQGFLINFTINDDSLGNKTQLFVVKGVFYMWYREIAADGAPRNWQCLNGPAAASTYRPTIVPVGGSCFDTTLNKPIWWNGTDWVDSNGTTV